MLRATHGPEAILQGRHKKKDSAQLVVNEKATTQ